MLQVKFLWDSPVILKRSTEGSVVYDISVACSCVIPARGKRVVQIGLALSLLVGVYVCTTPRSGLEVKKFIGVGAGVIDRDYKGEIGVVLFKTLSGTF